MSTSPETYSLPPDPRGNACGAFFDVLKTHRGKPIVVDASAVERMDTLVAQVMLFGLKTWVADDVAFEVASPSEVVTTALGNLGLDALILEREVADVD